MSIWRDVLGRISGCRKRSGWRVGDVMEGSRDLVSVLRGLDCERSEVRS